MVSLNRNDLLERLQNLDKDASRMFHGDERFVVVIVGGGALILMGYTNKTTHDIDVLNATNVSCAHNPKNHKTNCLLTRRASAASTQRTKKFVFFISFLCP